MKVGVCERATEPLSVSSYREAIVQELSSIGIEFVSLNVQEPIPSDLDLIWDPGLTNGSGVNKSLLLNRKPLCVTLHGATYFNEKFRRAVGLPIRNPLLSSRLRKQILWWYFFQWRVNTVITVSDFARSELTRHLSIKKDRIKVVWHGCYDVPAVLSKEASRIKEEVKGSRGFFLHISNYHPAKNIDRIFESWRKFVASYPEYFLVIICPGLNNAVSCENVIIINKLMNQSELRWFYQNAYVFLFPSLIESFGMPLVEAMRAGSPIITSNSGACPEIVEESALKINPLDTSELYHAMVSMMESPELRLKLVEKGMERSKAFTWDHCAKRHLDCFLSACK